MTKKTIIFDFDGVILDSHIVKLEAYLSIFRKFGVNVEKKVKTYHLKNSGLSRFIQFKEIYKQILKKNIGKRKLEYLSKKFNYYSDKKILKLKIDKDLMNFFKNSKKNYNLYISTGTPNKKINYITKKMKIFKYFKKIYGSPKSKIQHIKEIKKKEKNKITIFIGDSTEDYESAKKTNIFFILKSHNFNKNKFKNKRIKKIGNFKKLNKILKSLS
tara:strand:- start:236 stop:880 length:645 start_codon:yes stop_codon:yes gene_type:complete